MVFVTSCENTLYHNKVDYRFDVDDFTPLLTLSGVNVPLAIKSVRYPLIMQAYSDPEPKPTVAYKLYRKKPMGQPLKVNYLTKTIDNLR